MTPFAWLMDKIRFIGYTPIGQQFPLHLSAGSTVTFNGENRVISEPCVLHDKEEFVRFVLDAPRECGLKSGECTPLLRSVDDACYDLAIGRTQIYKLIKEQKLDAKKQGSRTYITTASIAKYVASLPALGSDKDR